MSRTFTTEETMLRVWDVEEIKKLMSRRVYYIANEWRARELDELWVSDPEHQKTASFGRNTGYYVGMEEIRKYYVDRHLAEMGDGTGYLSNHPVSTGLVREAEDGRTAKGMWYSIAQETRPNGDGTALALWMPEKIAVDFIREDDGWKIWHYFIGTDLQVEAKKHPFTLTIPPILWPWSSARPPSPWSRMTPPSTGGTIIPLCPDLMRRLPMRSAMGRRVTISRRHSSSAHRKGGTTVETDD